MLLLLVLAGCSGGGSDEECQSSVAQPIVGGRESLEDGGGDVFVRSLARISFGDEERGGICSGLALSSRTVLTAAHCVRSAEGAELRVEVPSATGELRGGVARGFREHDSLDVALIEVFLPDIPTAGSWRLATAEDQLAEGSRLTIAGYGAREDDAIGELRFVEEEVVAITAESIFVDGRGASGACDGDSGGPAFSLDRDEAIVFGTLSTGTASCRGVDQYLRVDAMADFIASSPRHPAGCGG